MAPDILIVLTRQHYDGFGQEEYVMAPLPSSVTVCIHIEIEITARERSGRGDHGNLTPARYVGVRVCEVRINHVEAIGPFACSAGYQSCSGRFSGPVFLSRPSDVDDVRCYSGCSMDRTGRLIAVAQELLNLVDRLSFILKG
ncbi:MAG: hypothetical protein ABSH25_02000 [Syntrophorhabdales bacterium]